MVGKGLTFLYIYEEYLQTTPTVRIVFVLRTDFATLTVDIINRNDEPPEFIRDGVSVATVEVNATEGQSSGITVIRLEV